MMPLPKIRTVAVLVGSLAMLGLAPSLVGQTTDPLGGFVTEALRNNLSLEAERLAERRSAAEVAEARGLFFPALTLDSRYSDQSGTLNLGDLLNPAFAALNQLRGTTDFPTNLDQTLPLAHESRLRLVQPLFNEAIRKNYSLARNRFTGQEARRIAAVRRLAADVQIAYLSLAAARSAAAVYESSLTLVVENERVTERLLAAGRSTPDAVFRARAERSDVAQRLAEAREQVHAAARVLNQLLGRPLDTPVAAIPDSGLTFELTIGEDSSVAHALAQREELAQIDAGIGAANAAVGIATAAFLPSVSLAVDYGFQGQAVRFNRENDYWVASVVVSWNLFNGGRDAARRSAARAEADRQRVTRRDVEERIRLEVRQAYQAAVVARSGVATAEDRVTAARRSFDLVRRRYEEGIATQIEFLDARTHLTNAELNRTLTAHRYAIRFVDLERAAALRTID
ncbi:MAG: TolC family protein [Gemmatimonadales bacterium]